jgi:CRP-like cAMP-binding protein
MTVVISPKIIKEIADYLDSGMNCYYHIATGSVEYCPNEPFELESWQDVMDKIEENPDDYIAFEAMESRESFRMMENFVEGIEDSNTRQRFEDAIAYRKPFQNFKQLLANYPDLRQQWFTCKEQGFIAWVQEQLDARNSAFS